MYSSPACPTATTKSPRFLALRTSPAIRSISQPQTPGPPRGSREVLAFAEVDDRDPRALDGRAVSGAMASSKRESRPRPSGCRSAKDVERLPEALEAVVEDVIVGQAGDLERDRGQAGDMRGQALEDRAALPDGLAGRRQGAFAVDDPEVGGAEDRKHVAVDGLRVPRDDRLEGPDRRPIRGDHDPRPAFADVPGLRFFVLDPIPVIASPSGSSRSMCRDPYLMNAATLWAWSEMMARVEASAS